MITFDTSPEKYNHWKLSIDAPVATLTLDIQEDKGLFPTYKLKLNSYDLGVDIELNDALNRIRFEHPEVKSVVVTSGRLTAEERSSIIAISSQASAIS